MTAKKLLKPHGKILYATCTPRPEENLKLLTPLFAQKTLIPLDLHASLKQNSKFVHASLVAKAQNSISYKIAKDYFPTQAPVPESCFLSIGESQDADSSDQASDTLKGDSFFYALVQ